MKMTQIIGHFNVSHHKRIIHFNIKLYFSEVKHFLTVDLKDVLTDPVTDDDVRKLMNETDTDGDGKISYRG